MQAPLPKGEGTHGGTLVIREKLPGMEQWLPVGLSLLCTWAYFNKKSFPPKALTKTYMKAEPGCTLSCAYLMCGGYNISPHVRTHRGGSPEGPHIPMATVS